MYKCIESKMATAINYNGAIEVDTISKNWHSLKSQICQKVT